MEVLMITPDWTVPYIAYLLRQELPEDEDEARQIVRRSKAFTVISGQLYRESVTGVAQCCISPEEGQRLSVLACLVVAYVDNFLVDVDISFPLMLALELLLLSV